MTQGDGKEKRMQGSEKLPRRSLLGLVTAGVASVVAGLHVSPVRAGKDNDEGTVARELEGTWLDTVTLAGPVPPPFDQPFQTLATYARGGGFISVASIVAPKDGNWGLGQWAKTGPHQYEVIQLQPGYDAQGVQNVWVKIRTSIQVGRDGKTYISSGLLQRLDTQFNVIVQVNATTHAIRIDSL
jgi:hypothetical protein